MYAEKTGNMEDTYKLAQELRDTLHHPDFRVHEQVIENARKELEAPVFLNEKKKNCLPERQTVSVFIS